MFVADVKCSQATWQTVPNSRTGSAKASVSEAVVHTWHCTRYQRKMIIITVVVFAASSAANAASTSTMTTSTPVTTAASQCHFIDIIIFKPSANILVLALQVFFLICVFFSFSFFVS